MPGILLGVGTVKNLKTAEDYIAAGADFLVSPGFVKEVADYGFKEIKLHSIEGRIDPRNKASGAVLLKAGFVQEAHFKENYFLRDHFADTAVFSLLTPYKQEVKHKSKMEETGVI